MLALLFLLATDVQGVINTNTTWSGSVRMLGDVTVAQGVTLTISEGTAVSVAATDAQAAGSDTARIELLIDGALAISGSAGLPVTFTPVGSDGSWVGIRVRAGGSANISHLTAGGGITTLEFDDAGTLAQSA